MSRPFHVEDGKLKLAQTTFVYDVEDDSFGTGTYQPAEEDYYNNGRAIGFGTQFAEAGDEVWFSITPQYDIEEPRMYLRERLDDRGASDFDDTVKLPGLKFSIGDWEEEFADPFSASFDPAEEEEMEWREFFVFGGSTLQAGESYEMKIEITSATEDEYDGVIYDVAVGADAQYVDQLNFDNEVHEPQGYLDGPELRPPEGVFVEAKEELTDTNITTARLNANYNDHTVGNQALQLSFDQGETYLPVDGTEGGTESVQLDASTTGVSIRGRAKLSAFPLDSSEGTAQNQTPRFGYDGHEIDSWAIDVDTDNLEILFDQNFNDNRLSVISNLADSSNHFFRWEGDVCRIFRQGDQKTIVDLNKENITSTTDIEDTYSSVQVIGRGGVQSPVIESENAPEYVDRHKEIRDRDIESSQDARRRALEFIADNGEIIYEGDIKTLPTRAPLGEEIDGSVFSHGKDMFIERVNYSKRSSSISFGRRRDLGREIMQLERSKRSSEILDTS